MKENIAVFGGGCFWCTEAIFSRLKGVHQVVPGYCGGHVENPRYEEVKAEKTGHIEVIKITFDPTVISYGELLEVFFNTHDPTTVNRQGEDVGSQYASVIFAQNEEQAQLAVEVKDKIQTEFEAPIVTKILPAETFWTAEEYHHRYFEQHPNQAYCSLVIAQKVQKFMQKYADKLK
ncbi:peptide-methionine (S)-S-oxide reductase MsrA [Pelistega sp. NLN82]|uniref:Peptide methionine sulfoxide reductase MsrA n=1 Tax=Pelistega ratti TaxID=2652177 RepID=A0A6L9Y852_9BURK|nr:peptide-methionine (S)-S-oxide reductase MsrA [Pelistega ratti]NEN76591.1 peptide-methionine (S)-S-oxide reductase MsrA [Pelistega ratti]